MEQQEIDYMMSNLQDYLELHGIDTSKLFRCLNPEHNDANPSMKYFDDNKVYCFGCGASYNLVDVISIMEGLDKKEAFKKAISDYCLEKPKNAYTKQVKNKAKNENLKGLVIGMNAEMIMGLVIISIVAGIMIIIGIFQMSKALQVRKRV